MRLSGKWRSEMKKVKMAKVAVMYLMALLLSRLTKALLELENSLLSRIAREL